MEIPHLLALKVMRLSRPALAQSQVPFVTEPLVKAGSKSESTFQEHVTTLAEGDPNKLNCIGSTSAQSLANDAALSPLFTLPAAFGTICLGETFAATLNLSNETQKTVPGAKLTVEMQSSTSKQLIEVKTPPGEGAILAGGDAMELSVEWEIKELGMHVLVCSVDYGNAVVARSFQKFYKFNVAPPLSIKTRVHLPLSANAMLASGEKDKVFLEVHVQNTSPATVTFDRLVLEPADGLKCVNVNDLGHGTGEASENVQGKSVFVGAFQSLMPQDTRQYLFILTQSTPPAADPLPGSVVPLGRLDITWRSSPFAERGRLLTSTLNRRVPGNPTSPTASLKPLPPHSQVTRVAGGDGRFSPLPPPLPPKDLRRPRKQCSLCVAASPRHGARVEDEFEVKIQVSFRRRRDSQAAAPPAHFGIQYVPFVPTAPPALISISSPNTASMRSDGRPSPLPSPTPFSTPPPPSRPMTPVTSQLRQATTLSMAADVPVSRDVPAPVTAFPPLARRDTTTQSRDAAGRVSFKGATLAKLVMDDFTPVQQSDSEERWEQASNEAVLRFTARSAGLAQLGGLRILDAETESWTSGEVIGEEKTLGCVWIYA